ncbi:uncharacterized protein F5891DRAFT_1185508 [Suillus fuscotomentosus]|uniref:Uncharacterized protein n=1 Tax=Suillus fuscotomentosus TaxID=1912939 RepID=A0AAD4EC07_9AGAM|nr:uncharacterized protein F5891DRAFT_1185508 [Suillus fuscotomentosus]KAG1903367.1 hypothetical protein F5891DRAFT_1185508 [Suillus fuscotomentosus]
MRFFLTLSLILPSVLAAPFKFPTHHQHSPPCVITGVAYLNPRHALVLLGKREPDPPTRDSECVFPELSLFYLFYFIYISMTLYHIGIFNFRLRGPAENDSVLGTTTPGGAPLASSDQNASSPTAASPSTAPATTTSPAPSPSETHGSTTAGLTSTGTLAGSDSDAHGTSANTARNPSSENAASFADLEITLTQSGSSAFDTPIPQDMTAGFSSPVMDSSVSDSFGDVSGTAGANGMTKTRELDPPVPLTLTSGLDYDCEYGVYLTFTDVHRGVENLSYGTGYMCNESVVTLRGTRSPSFPTLTAYALLRSTAPSWHASLLPKVAAAGTVQMVVLGDRAVGARAHAPSPMSRKEFPRIY